MPPNPEKAPKKVKDKKQAPEERLEALRYNHMMYGRTEGEMALRPRKVDYGASFLKHPKFQSLMSAFKNGTAFNFDITIGDKLFSIATDGSHISYDGKVLYYSRPLNKFEDNLLLDRVTAIKLQNTDAAVHLVFATLRSLPDLADHHLTYQHRKFYHGAETLDAIAEDQGSNLLLGCFRHNKAKARK
jgi:hypothetical protein